MARFRSSFTESPCDYLQAAFRFWKVIAESPHCAVASISIQGLHAYPLEFLAQEFLIEVDFVADEWPRSDEIA